MGVQSIEYCVTQSGGLAVKGIKICSLVEFRLRTNSSREGNDPFWRTASIIARV